MEVIPAIDLRDGRCVRLVQGDFAQETIFSTDPAAVARRWQEAGAPRIHVVDLEGAASGRPRNPEAVVRILESVDIPIQLGGGVRNMNTLESWISVGVQRVVLGTAAAENPDFLVKACSKFGDAVIVGIDARNGKAAASGWTRTTEVDALSLIRRVADHGARRIIYTDIATDGMLSGPNLDSVRQVMSHTQLPVIASGGVTTIDHLISLSALGVEGAIIGRALYTGDLDLREVIKAVS